MLEVPGREIIWHDTIDSTMTAAGALAEAGCPAGTVVAADEQTAGQGRLGRAWHSEKGAGLYLSVVLRPRLAGSHLPVVTLALGLAAVEAIASTAGIACDLRWPNDIMIDDRKCGGILVQLHGSAIVAGIGINVNHQKMPIHLAGIATSLRIALRRELSRDELAAELLASIDRHISILEDQGPVPILTLFTQASSYARGRRVVVHQDSGPIEGVTHGLTPEGFLRLRRSDGRDTVVIAGGVRPVS